MPNATGLAFSSTFEARNIPGSREIQTLGLCIEKNRPLLIKESRWRADEQLPPDTQSVVVSLYSAVVDSSCIRDELFILLGCVTY
jgi:hypothetical protein